MHPRQTAVTGQFDLTLTGAPTANGSKFYLTFFGCAFSLNLLVASPLRFLGRYLFRRSKVGEANPCSFNCALALFTIVPLSYALIYEDSEVKTVNRQSTTYRAQRTSLTRREGLPTRKDKTLKPFLFLT